MAPDGSSGNVSHLSPASAQPLFPIRVVARLTGIKPVTIRAWERRYGLVAPERTPGGHRLYSRADVDRLRSASRLISQGLPISQASKLLDSERSALASRPDHAVERFLERVRRLDEEGMTALYQAIRSRADDGAAASAMLAALPAALDNATPVERRFAEAWLSALLGARLQASLPDEEAARVIVCVSGDGPERTWGNVLALLLAERGLRPLLLGPLSGDALADAAAGAGCSAVVVSGGCRVPAGSSATFFRGPFGHADDGGVGLEGDLAAAAGQVADGVLIAEAAQ